LTRDDETSLHRAVSADNEQFMSGSNVYRRNQPGELGNSMESLSLDESWPDSERSSITE